MKKFTQKLISTVILITAIALTVHAQTNVSGGIYTNTTWTLANSPYIVVDTVVVFPGVTLTIEPGVVVKFENNKLLEIRQATISAIGTITDSITFTSNAAFPAPGIWAGILLKSCTATAQFKYCNFKYADMLFDKNTSPDSLILKSSSFNYNNSGIGDIYISNGKVYIDSCVFTNNGLGMGRIVGGTITSSLFSNNQIAITLQSCKMANCIFKNNQRGINTSGGNNNIKNCVIDSNTIYGVNLKGGGNDSLVNCEIMYNGIGLSDSNYTVYPSNSIIQNRIENNDIGIKSNHNPNSIYCNKICNNSTYDFSCFATVNLNISGNYWCTTDSAIILGKIYDGYDNVSLGLVTFMPIDTDSCYLSGCNLSITSIITNATCDTCHNGSATAVVGNGFAPYFYTWYTAPIQTTQTATGLSAGNYTICVTDANGCTACHSVFVDSSNCTGFAINANANNSTCSTCNDGYAWVTVAGGTAPYYYTWYTTPMQSGDTAAGLLPGTYVVCITDLYGCSACDTVVVSTGNCSAHFNLYPDTIPHNYIALNMASGVAPLSYSWSWGDGSPNDIVPFPNHTYAAAGFYTICLTITDAVGCINTYCNSFYLQKTSNTMVNVSVVSQTSLGVNEASGDESVLIFPNPVTGNKLNIVFQKNPDAIFTIELFDVSGRRVFAQNLSTAKSQAILLPHIANGIYHAVIKNTHTSYNQKFVVMEK